MQNKKPPRILTDAGLSMFVNTVKLRELPLPAVEIDMADLIWHFEMPVWEKDGTDDWNLTPWEVIKELEGAKAHRKRAEEADLSRPIVVTRLKSRYVILDGVHRLVKAYINNQKTIKAEIIPRRYLKLRELRVS